jgi:hypothetical protein
MRNQDRQERIQNLAGKLKRQFVTRERDNKEKFTCVNNSDTFFGRIAQDLAHDVHENVLPNDAIYEELYHSLDRLETYFVDQSETYIEADCYTHDLINWTRNSFSHDFLDEGLEYCFRTYNDLLMYANENWKRSIHDKVYEYLDQF